MADAKLVTAFLKGKVSALLDGHLDSVCSNLTEKWASRKSLSIDGRQMLFPFPDKLSPVEDEVLKLG